MGRLFTIWVTREALSLWQLQGICKRPGVPVVPPRHPAQLPLALAQLEINRTWLQPPASPSWNWYLSYPHMLCIVSNCPPPKPALGKGLKFIHLKNFGFKYCCDFLHFKNLSEQAFRWRRLLLVPLAARLGSPPVGYRLVAPCGGLALAQICGPGGILILRTTAKSSRGASPHPSPTISWSPKHFISPFCFVSLWQANPGVWQLRCRVSRNSSVFFLAADTGSNVNEFSIPDCAFGSFPKHEEAAKRTQSLKKAGNSISRGLKKCYSNENTMKPENNILMCGELKYPEIALLVMKLYHARKRKKKNRLQNSVCRLICCGKIQAV